MFFLFLLQVEKVRLLDRVSPKRSRVGTLYLTATHIIFVDNEAGVRNETWVCISAPKDQTSITEENKH